MSVRVRTDRSTAGVLVQQLPSRRAAVVPAVITVAAFCLFAGLAIQVTNHEGLIRSDPRLLHDIIGVRTGALTALAKVITNLGTGVTYLFLAGAGYRYWYKKRSVALPVAALLWMAIGLTLRLVISRAISRPRPLPALRLVGANGFAFPSGHTTTATISFGLMVLLLWQVVARRWLVPIAVVAVLVAVTVGLSRSYLGVHWPTDVIGGWLFGTGWVALGALMSWFATLIRHFATDRRASLGSNLFDGGHA